MYKITKINLIYLSIILSLFLVIAFIVYLIFMAILPDINETTMNTIDNFVLNLQLILLSIGLASLLVGIIDLYIINPRLDKIDSNYKWKGIKVCRFKNLHTFLKLVWEVKKRLFFI